jgi:hypothetical protein
MAGFSSIIFCLEIFFRNFCRAILRGDIPVILSVRYRWAFTSLLPINYLFKKDAFSKIELPLSWR